MMIKLSARLAAIADQVPHGKVLADIGTDHALLPVYLVQRGVVPRAVAGELNAGPYEAARLQVSRYGLQHRIDVRRGNGLSVLQPDEADTVTIAGMGGGLISDILSQGLESLKGVGTLVLQPNVAEDAVRQWLIDHDYVLLQERILTEDGVTYVILHAEHAQNAAVSNGEIYRPRTLDCGLNVDVPMLVRFGPYLLERMEEAFIVKWQEERDKLERIKRQITEASSASQSAGRLREIEQEIERITEVLQCSQKVRQSSR